jgi:hypothetical protein
MFLLLLVVVALLVTAAVSAWAAHRRYEGTAWSSEYGQDRLGLTIELATLALVVLVGVAISIIMADSFRSLFLEGGWRSFAYLAAAGIGTLLIAYYHFVSAPRSLAVKHDVDESRVGRECRLPYLVYTPYSLIMWVGFVLAVLALLVVSVRSDHGEISSERRDLEASGAQVVLLAEQKPGEATDHVAIYGLDYRSAVDVVQRTVGRYLWVVGVFIVFLIVLLNTRITDAYSAAAVDIFKIMMWGLLAIAVAICLWGVVRFQDLQDLAIAAHESLVSGARDSGQLELEVASAEALLEIEHEGPVRVLRGGFIALLSLVVFTNAFQALMAKATNRSALHVIFPARVARFLDGFLLSREEPPPQRS